MSTQTFGMIRFRPQKHVLLAGKEKKKNKDGDVVEKEVYEKCVLPTPFAYDIVQLRKFLRERLKRLIHGTSAFKSVQFCLERYPQVFTVMGEINAQLPKDKRLKFGWTTADEDNTLFVVSVA